MTLVHPRIFSLPNVRSYMTYFSHLFLKANNIDLMTILKLKQNGSKTNNDLICNFVRGTGVRSRVSTGVRCLRYWDKSKIFDNFSFSWISEVKFLDDILSLNKKFIHSKSINNNYRRLIDNRFTWQHLT